MVLTPSTMAPLGSSAPDFSLPDPDGRVVSKADFAGMPLLVMFICNHCPFVIHLKSALSSFAREQAARGVAVVAINSNDFHEEKYADDAPEKMKEDAAAFDYSFPYLVDESQEVAKAYTAACTPDFFLYDADHRLRYRGQFDGSRPESGVPVTGDDLRAAIDAVLAGEAPSEEQRPSMGCNIKWRPGNEPPYFG
ncbi:MAG: thioredoxin family protein [Planctomycetota bacterium JB042]